VGTWGGRGATRWRQGRINLWDQMGCSLGSGLFSVCDTEGTSLRSMCRKMISAIAFLLAPSAAKLEKKRKRKEGWSETGQGELVHMENKSHISKLVWGMNFPVAAHSPQFYQTVPEHVSPPAHVLYPLWHGTVPLPPRMPCVCRVQGGKHCAAVTCCLPHPSKQPSLSLSATLLWGMYGNYQLRLLTLSWFLLFLSYIIHFSYLY